MEDRRGREIRLEEGIVVLCSGVVACSVSGTYKRWLLVWLGLAFESSRLLLPAAAAEGPPASARARSVGGWEGRGCQ